MTENRVGDVHVHIQGHVIVTVDPDHLRIRNDAIVAIVAVAVEVGVDPDRIVEGKRLNGVVHQVVTVMVVMVEGVRGHNIDTECKFSNVEGCITIFFL